MSNFKLNFKFRVGYFCFNGYSVGKDAEGAIIFALFFITIFKFKIVLTIIQTYTDNRKKE